MTRETQNTGFTLIELIVVMALIAMLLFFTVPRLGDTFVFNDSAKKSSRWIITEVRQLKHVAARDQRPYMLNVDLDANRFWVSSKAETETSESSAADTLQLPPDLNITAVEFPGSDPIQSGKAEILFHKQGYSDKALIHIENHRGEKMSFLIEPFLKRVKFYDRQVGFDD